MPLLECVPNFSEGRDPAVIEALAAAISSVTEVHLLHVDPGPDANRTVFSFAGPPEAVIEAAFRSITLAAGRIDMRKHQGAHPRIGACDVCPLIPLDGMTMEEAVRWARDLAERVGNQLQIPVFLYENSATRPERRNLANIRKGEYEGLEAKTQDPLWAPDFGPAIFNRLSGAIVIGARPFLIAFNVNLDTDKVELAQKIARRVRESGGWEHNEAGEKERISGGLKSLKAIGWFMQAYECAQVSMNLVNFEETGLHQAFEACKATAKEFGIGVRGAELIGLAPKKSMLQAGAFYASPNQPKNEKMLIEAAIEGLELNALGPFNSAQRILEEVIPSGFG